MPQHKVLPSIAHNVGQLFTRPSHEDDGHLLSDLLASARKAREATVHVDVLTGEARPEALVSRSLARALARHAKGFPALVTGHNCDMSFVKAARMTVTFDVALERPAESAARTESPYVIRVEIDDDRGKTWHAELRGWCAAGRTRDLMQRLTG